MDEREFAAQAHLTQVVYEVDASSGRVLERCVVRIEDIRECFLDDEDYFKTTRRVKVSSGAYSEYITQNNWMVRFFPTQELADTACTKQVVSHCLKRCDELSEEIKLIQSRLSAIR